MPVAKKLHAGCLCLALTMSAANAGPGRTPAKTTHGKKASAAKPTPKGDAMTPPDAPARATFALPGGPLVVTEADLAALKTVVLTSLRASKDPMPPVLEAELAPAAPDIDADDVCRIGPWILQTRGGELRLTHQPGRASVMYMHYAVVTRKDGHWLVTRWGVERVTAR